MDLDPVRDAYAAIVDRYVALPEDGRDAPDRAFIHRHLTGLDGTVLDLGCGPGRWTADLHAHGVDVVGVDLVPEFLEHARATYPGPELRLGSMTDLDVPEHSAAGVLSWYSTIHFPPDELGGVLAGFRRLLAPSGVLVVGFFDSDDDVAAFDHAVIAAYRWPADVFADLLVRAGFVVMEEVEPYPPKPERKYAALAARAI